MTLSGPGSAPYDSIQMSKRLNNGWSNDRPHKKYLRKIFFNCLQMNFRNGNYITSNLLDREFGIIEFLVLLYDLDCRMLEF